MSKAGTADFLIGQYRIGENIGEGTFGKVKLGVHVHTGQKVAIKTLQKEKIVEQADIERVTREICILKILRHPNIIQLYEIIETKTDIHLIMEYAEGGELFDHIVKNKRLPEAEAVGFMQQILSGVEYIHKNGIVHRDLKPQNLLLDQNKNIKIVDFGLSNQYKPGERLKTACGSPCYAAPEMIAGKRYECIGVDVWSCGIILYAMLCGFLPFEDPNTNKLYKKIMAGDFQTPKVLSPDSKDMLKAILDVNPETRYSIDRIRQTKWYRNAGKNYVANGIIVGKDPIEVDQRLVRIMQKHGVDPAQIKNYVTNNRHNHITAFYYLLKKKAQKEPGLLEQQPAPVEKRSDSPLIYRPEQKKDYYIPQKKISVSDNKDNSRRDDSFNASNIVSSLLEANRNKYVTNPSNNPNPSPNASLPNRLIKKQDPNNFKLQEFKLFPKKKNSSIYEQNTSSNSKSAMTSRSETEEKLSEISGRPSISQSEQVQPHPPAQELQPQTKEEQGSINKKRQQLSDQLRQISQKIDKEIIELRKQNNMGATLTDSVRKRDSFGPNTTHLNASTQLNATTGHRPKTQEAVLNPSSANNSRETLTSFKEMRESTNGSKLAQFKQPSGVRYPKIHIGPFNSQCLFCQPPKSLMVRIAQCLGKLGLRHAETDPFTLQLTEAENVSVMSLQGISGYFLVHFSTNSPLNETIIEHLNK